MNTEITEYKNGQPPAERPVPMPSGVAGSFVAWVLYDGDCRLCTSMVDHLRPLLHRHNFGLAPLQAKWVRERLSVFVSDKVSDKVGDKVAVTEMVLLTSDGRRYGGPDAILKAAEFIWWAWPFARVATLLGLRPLLRRVYRHIAARRHCWNGGCQIPTAGWKALNASQNTLAREPQRKTAWPALVAQVSNLLFRRFPIGRPLDASRASELARRLQAGSLRYSRLETRATPRKQNRATCPPVDICGYATISMWLPGILLPVFAIFLTASSPRWLVMWATAFSIWLACKWLTIWQAHPIWPGTSALRVIAYFLAWPGMNARTFLDPAQKPSTQTTVGPFLATARIATGAALIWIIAPLALGTSPLVVGWLAMLGMVLILHFGVFDLLAWVWQRANIVAPRLMDRPTRSTSVAEFWGRRWNFAFHELAQTFVFNPVQACFGRAAAVCAVFIVSGLIHDLVISLPARGGYGLPTAYFGLQAAALLFERSKAGRRLGLGRGWRGRVFAVAIIAISAFWLFHPQFIQTVILPFMEAIGALNL